MKKAIALAFALVVAIGASAAAFAKPTAKAAASATTAVSCSKVKIAFMGPLTGPAGFLGQEQLSWAQYGAKTLPAQGYPKVQLLAGDTQLDPALASSLAQKYVADPTVMALIGPSTSSGVAAAGPTFTAAKLPAISPSATKATLTKGDSRIQGFWRDVPDDSVQGPSDARFMISKGAKKVVIIDDQEIYSTGLADAATGTLKAKGVEVIRLSVSQSVTDFSSYVTKVPNDADFVFIPWQQPPAAQTFAQQMAEQGKKATIFGSDGTSSADQFKAPGAYVSVFAPDITALPADKALVAGWQKANGGKSVGPFGPPSYGAVQIALSAIKKACTAKGGTISRSDVYFRMNSVKIKNWLLGGSFAFSTKTHDPKNGKFYIFQIQSDGKYKFVG
jgi:branched-chain amino acid transport system substrate-binding protein